MQTLLVIITFTIAAGYLLKKFLWVPVFDNKRKNVGTLDGGNTKCGKKDCGCH